MSRISIIFNSIRQSFVLKKKNVRFSPLAMYDKRCTFEANIHVDRFSILHNCQIGSYTYITTNCEISNCQIGKFCSVAGGVKIGLGKHPLDKISTSPVFYSNKNRMGIKWNNDLTVSESSRTHIGNDVWIGTNAIIVGGVRVGTGAVIAAGAVVTKDVPPYAVVAGVPARVIKYRFSQDVIDALLNCQWWNLPESDLINIAKGNHLADEFVEMIK